MRNRSRHGVSRSVMAAVVVLLVITAASLLYAGSVTTTAKTTVTSPTTTTQTVTTQTTTTQTTAITTTTTQTVTTTAVPAVVNLDIIPDWGGPGYDAFVVPTGISNSVPKPVSTSQPGPNNANVTVTAGVPTTFVITNLDTMNFTFKSTVTVPFTVFNDTANGYVALPYTAGQSVSMIASHTFTITALNINIPTPPDTVVTFTYTFAKPGIYRYFCLTPCGPGMSVVGYMIGYVIVK